MHRDNEESKKKVVGTVGVDATLFSEKKAGPIDIPKIPFDADHYQQALKLGFCRTKEEKTYIDLERLHAPQNKPGSGFGTAKFREIVKRSDDLKCPGQIITDASTSYGSPHLFYLYMGMVPADTQVNYVETKYGDDGSVTLEELEKCKEWSVEALEKSLDSMTLSSAKRILSKELKVPNENVSTEDLIKHKEMLLGLQHRRLDYVSEVFIPKLLKILAKDPKNKYPDTKSLGPMPMRLSEQGYARWKYVIENGLEFVPFRNLEHLNLNSDQKALLQEILAKRIEIRPTGLENMG